MTCKLSYDQSDFLIKALAALGNAEGIHIVIGSHKSSVQKALMLYDDYFNSDKRSLRTLFKFGITGISTPSLWVVLNKAHTLGRTVKSESNAENVSIYIS